MQELVLWLIVWIQAAKVTDGQTFTFLIKPFSPSGNQLLCALSGFVGFFFCSSGEFAS